MESRNWGGIIIFRREEEGWKVEGLKNFGPNVVSFTITSGKRQWYVVRAYVPPNDQPAVHWVAQSLTCGTAGLGDLLVSDLNT